MSTGWRRAGSIPRPSARSGSARIPCCPSAHQPAAESLCIAWLPASLVADDLRERRLVEAGPRAWHIEIEIRLFRRREVDAPTAEAFWRAAGGD
jgi:DNA-binding transcriptional LysR family regulator